MIDQLVEYQHRPVVRVDDCVTSRRGQTSARQKIAVGAGFARVVAELLGDGSSARVVRRFLHEQPATVAKLEARRAREQPYARADGFGVAHLDGFAEGPRQPRVALLTR